MKRMTLKQENAYMRRVLLRIATCRADARPLAQQAFKRMERPRRIDTGIKIPNRKPNP